MENQQNQQPVVQVLTLKPKSNAPWILGIIGFCTSIPNVLCAMLCAGLVAGVTETNAAANGQKADTSGIAVHLLAIVVVSVLCFILSFFGKSKKSVITGILMLLGGLFIAVTAFIGFGNWFWGLTSGVLYAIGGALSITNRKLSK